MPNKIFAGLVAAALVALPAGSALAQGSSVKEYGEVPELKGKAQATVTVPKGNFATLIATARVVDGTPAGSGVLPRAGVGVDIFVNDKTCSADRDVRRQVDVAAFKGKFATSTTCMTVLRPGQHVILAERTGVNVEGAKMEMKYTVLGGEPDKMNVPAQ